MKTLDSRAIDVIDQPFDVSLTLPGSKSIALRQLAMSALKPGTTKLYGLPSSSDINAMKTCLRRLGVSISESDPCVIQSDDLDLSSDVELDAHMSGTSLRILLGIAGLRSGSTKFDGHRSLRARPNEDLLVALRDLGCQVESDQGRLPITVTGPIKGFEVKLRADVSSQFLTALLIAAPRCASGLHIALDGTLASRPYIDLTLAELRKRGVEVETDSGSYSVSRTTYKEDSVEIEGDASGATYFAALATMHASAVRFTNLSVDSIQGDAEFFEICERIGARVTRNGSSITVKGPRHMRAFDTWQRNSTGRRRRMRVNQAVNMESMPDAAPTLMAMAPFLDSTTNITGLSTLRDKECDRIACPAKELRSAGVSVDEGPDYLVIHPSSLRPHTFETYDDHRMAMAFAVFATKNPGCRILDPDCVTKTYSEFWSHLQLLYDQIGQSA